MTLHNYQREGAAWVGSRKRALLGDVPGVGKTRTLIAALQFADARRPLVICPAIVRSHWRREFEALNWQGAEPIIYSYEQIQRGGNSLMAQLLGKPIDALILDEAHYLRNPQAQRTKQILGKDGYALRVPRVWAASGTPMWKHPGDLWTLLARLFPEAVLNRGFRTAQQFLDHFCKYYVTEFGPKVYDVKNEDELQALLGEVMLRRELDDIGVQLPGLQWSTLSLDAPKPAGLAELEQSPELEAFREAVWASQPLDGAASFEPIAKYRRLVGEAKAPAVGKMLREQLDDSDEKVVVFAHHRSVLHALRAELTSLGLAYVDGDSPQKWRDAAIGTFQNDPRCRVFLGQIIACQTGITLTAARRVVIVEPDWSAVVNYQAAMRVCRIGQTADTCLVQMIALAGTLDDAIVRQHEREARIAATVNL